jgi:GNAT superfamily N-acetyltransferase
MFAGSEAQPRCVSRWSDEIRIVDIALLPDACNRGIGTALLRQLQAEAQGAGQATPHPRGALQSRAAKGVTTSCCRRSSPSRIGRLPLELGFGSWPSGPDAARSRSHKIGIDERCTIGPAWAAFSYNQRMIPSTNLATLIRERAACFARFAAWETSHPARLTPAAAVAAIGALYQLLPAASRRRPVDTSGVARLHDALRHLT